MITESTLYWITRLDYIKNAAITLMAVFGIALVVSAVMTISAVLADISEQNKFRRYTKISFFGFIVALCLCVVTPTTKEMAMIKVIPAIVNREAAERIKTDFGYLYKMAIDCAEEKLKGEKK